jgi:HEAT repeat protein
MSAAWSTGTAARKAAGPPDGKSLAELAAILTDSPDELARHNAVKAIAARAPDKQRRTARPPKQTPQYASADEKVVAVLVGGLGDKAGSVRHACREALGRCGAAAIGPLVQALASENTDVRSYAADALGDVAVYDDADAQPLDQAVPALSELLGDKQYAVRVSAAMALGRIGARAAPALAKLITLLDDPEWAVADAAVPAVAAADPPNGTRSVAALVKVLGNKNHDLREFVCSELGDMGPKAEAAIPALIELLDADRDSWQAGKAAAEALAAIVSVDPKAPKAPKVPDETRTIAIASIARSAAAQKAPFMQDARLFALLPNLDGKYGRHHYTGPLGREALPALPAALRRLRLWMAEGTGWVPRRELVAFIAEVGVYAKDEVTGVAKALLADKKPDPAARRELEGLLKKLAD